MVQALRMLSGGIADFATRQPRVALGGAGLGVLLLAELAALVVARAFA